MRDDDAGHLYLRLPAGGPAWPGCAAIPMRGDRPVTASLDGALRCRWVTAFEFDGGGIHRTVPDGRGNRFVAGWFSGQLGFPGRRIAARSTRSDVFVARLDAEHGRIAWGAGLVAVDAVPAGNIPAALAIDGDGHPWVGGQYFGAIDVAQPGQPSRVLAPAAAVATAGEGGSDAFVVRLDGTDGRLR